MKRKEIVAALTPLYRTARGENRSIAAAYMATDDDYKARSIARTLSKSYGFLEGMEAAAKALGVSIWEII